MAKKSRTREAKERRQKQQRQNQMRIAVIAIVIVAVLGIALIIISNQPAEAFVPNGLESRFEGLPQSFSDEGYPRIGDPDAPVLIEEYASFSCPGCEALHSTSFEAILERVKLGQVLFTYVPLQTGSIANAEGAARAALCAGQQGKFWEMHDLLFDWHTRYGNTAFSQNRLLAGVEAMGLNSTSFTNCFNSPAISTVLDSALQEGVTSTPTIDVNGVNVPTAESGGIPTTEEILTAVNGATPNDWRPSAPSDDTAESVDDTSSEATEEADVEAVDTEATEEADAQTVDTEATEEAGD